jgi:LPXTG-motif cell wall-anchored protein
LILGAALLLWAPLVPRFLAKVRQGDEEWRRRWRALDRGRRRAILRTMRKGQPVAEPEDADLALRAIAQIDHVRRAMRPLEWIGLGALVAILIDGIVSGDDGLLLIPAAGLALTLSLGALSWRRRRQLERSAAATRRLKRT